ncbi:MAG: DUF3108 domain-containing protein [Desulfobacterales bacterium]|nr:DUF3108 domain-containing protein [Desulfobacterales bacterium]
MHRISILAISCLLLVVSLPTAVARPAGPLHGVRFHYRAHKLGATIIKASLSIERDGPFHVVKATVDSSGVARTVFRMHNRFTSYIKEAGLEPWRYIKEVDQKGIFSKKKHYTDILTFDPVSCKVFVERVDPSGVQEISVPPQTYDPLSIFLKIFLGSEIVNGEKIEMKIYDGIRLKEVTFFVASDEITIHLYGLVKAISLESKVPFSSLGDKEGVIKIWYTDDERRFPVAMSLKLPSVGNVDFELERVETW